jgi:endonuclease III related protein
MEKVDLIKIYERLYKYFGPQEWWPLVHERDNYVHEGSNVDPRFEICVGAILTQNTAWTNVEKALANLIAARLLGPDRLVQTSLPAIKKAIKPAGYFNQKAKKLQLFSQFVLDHGGLDELFQLPIAKLREALLGVWGIGPETADSIILYAAKKPVFVIDTYTKRLLEQFSVHFKTYDEYREFFESQLPRQVKMWNEYHALIVAWGKLYTGDQKTAYHIISA